MGNGCAVGFPKENGEQLTVSMDEAVEDTDNGDELGDLSSARKVAKVRGMLAEETEGGGRLTDEGVKELLRSASKASMEYGYRRHIEECMARLEIEDGEGVRHVNPSKPTRQGSRQRTTAAAAAPQPRRTVKATILSNINDDSEDEGEQVKNKN